MITGEALLAYMAGIVDGEGTITLSFNARRHNGIKGSKNEARTVLDQADKILMLSLNKRENEEASRGL